MSVGGATGLAMLAQAARLVESGAARHVLVVAGEDRASGQTRETSTKVLAQVGHAALRGAARRHRAGVLRAAGVALPLDLRAGPEALAALPVQMRTHAGAQARSPVPEADHGRRRAGLAARRRAAAAARLLPGLGRRSGVRRLRGPHLRPVPRHRRHGAGAPAPAPVRARARRARVPRWRRNGRSRRPRSPGTPSTSTASTTASRSRSRCSCEELGLTPPGRAGAYARAGAFEVDGRYPMNTHGGLLSYGHCGVGGGMAHLAEVAAQLRHERGASQVAVVRRRLRARRRRGAVGSRRGGAAPGANDERARLPDWTDGEPVLLVTDLRPVRQPLVPPARPLPGVRLRRRTPRAARERHGLCVAVTRLHVTAGDDVTDRSAWGWSSSTRAPSCMGRIHDDELAPGDRARIDFRPDGHGRALVPSFAQGGLST